MLSSAELETLQREQKNTTQPDFFSVGDNANVAIELKTSTKSSLGQLEKYAKFNDSIGVLSKPLTIHMLTPYEATKVFADQVSTFKAADIRYVSFKQWYAFLEEIGTSNEVERKLVDGMAAYLHSYFGDITNGD